LIRSGQVRVNGTIVTELGSKADPEHDRVEVAGRVAEVPEERAYILLNKPPQVVSTMADPEDRTTLRHFLRGMPERVFPVGRLDYAASGLVLLTSDGELAARVLRASALLRQTYWVKVKGRISESEMRDAGRAASAHFVPLKGPWAKRSAANPWYEVELTGASRDALGHSLKRQDHPIEKMKRVQLATLELGNVPEGHYRRLEPAEVDKFSRAVDRALAEKNGATLAAQNETPRAMPERAAAPPNIRPPVALPNVRPPLVPPNIRPSFSAPSNRPQPRPRQPWRARQSSVPPRSNSGRAPGSPNFFKPSTPSHQPGAPVKEDWRARKSGPWRGSKSGSASQPRDDSRTSTSNQRPGAPNQRPGAPPKKDWRAQKSGPWRDNKSGGAPNSPNHPRPGQPTHRPSAPQKDDWRTRKSGPWRGNKTDGTSQSRKQPWPGAPTHRPSAPAKDDWRARKSSPWRGNKTGGAPTSPNHPRPGAPNNRPGAPAKQDWRAQKSGPWRGNKTGNAPRSQNNPGRPPRPHNSGPKHGNRPDRDPRHTPRHSR
jgi:23S rRNA pseudouridine2605 synthase